MAGPAGLAMAETEQQRMARLLLGQGEDQLVAPPVNPMAPPQAIANVLRGVAAKAGQLATTPGTIAAGVQPQTPGQWSEEDQFRQDSLTNAPYEWAPEMAMGMAGAGGVGVPRGAVGAAGGKLVQPEGIRAYHGSPHDFERFDLSKIGTGEGAQAYGHGLYFAENPAVAESYKLVNQPSYINHITQRTAQDAFDLVNKTARPGEDIMASTRSSLQRALEMETDPTKQRRYMDAINNLPELVGQSKVGKMYEVNINAKPEQFLDWDRPLSEHSPYVQDAVKRIEGAVKKTEAMPNAGWHEKANGRLIFGDGLAVIEKKGDGYFVQSDSLEKTFPTLAEAKKGGEDYVRRSFEDSAAAANNVSGVQIMRNIGEHLAGGDKIRGQLMRAEVSAAIREAGIPGIKYLDQGSRTGGPGTSNYVVFDDKLIDILRKYGLAGAAPIPPAAIAKALLQHDTTQSQ